jgi:hypothetical protein
MQYRVLALTLRPHEWTLINRPKAVEQEVGLIETRDRIDAFRALARGIAEGRYPAGSRLEEVAV